MKIVYPPIPDLNERKIVTQLNSTVTINFTIEAFPRPEPRGVTWVRLREDSVEGWEVEDEVEGWEGVEDGVEDDWIELNQDVGPDKVIMSVILCLFYQVEVTVTISPITRHHLNSTFALRVANSEGHQLYRQA